MFKAHISVGKKLPGQAVSLLNKESILFQSFVTSKNYAININGDISNSNIKQIEAVVKDGLKNLQIK